MWGVAEKHLNGLPRKQGRVAVVRLVRLFWISGMPYPKLRSFEYDALRRSVCLDQWFDTGDDLGYKS